MARSPVVVDSVDRPLRQVAVRVPGADEDQIGLQLAALTGQGPSIYTDAATGESTFSVFLPLEDAAVAPLRRQIRENLRPLAPGALPRVSIRRVPPQDWSESWKRHFRPLEIGPELLVQPTWSRRKPRAGQAVVLLDPGLSFGTGQHATTRFCLHQLVAHRGRSAERSFLDLGTGSGVLAIAAAKLGYTLVDGLDYDADAIRIARENAALNQVTDQVGWSVADVTRLPQRPERVYDVVAANLIYDLLLAERDRIVSRVRPEGVLILAGILTVQFPAVEAAFNAAGWRRVAAKTEREWRSGSFRRV